MTSRRKDQTPHVSKPSPRLNKRSNGDDVEARTDCDSSSRILSVREVVEMQAKCQQYALSFLPNAIRVIADTTRSGNPRLRLLAAVKLCEITRLSKDNGVEGLLRMIAALNREQGERKRLFYGSLLAMTLNKSERYQIPTSPMAAKQLEELRDKIEVALHPGDGASRGSATPKG